MQQFLCDRCGCPVPVIDYPALSSLGPRPWYRIQFSESSLSGVHRTFDMCKVCFFERLEAYNSTKNPS